MPLVRLECTAGFELPIRQGGEVRVQLDEYNPDQLSVLIAQVTGRQAPIQGALHSGIGIQETLENVGRAIGIRVCEQRPLFLRDERYFCAIQALTTD